MKRIGLLFVLIWTALVPGVGLAQRWQPVPIVSREALAGGVDLGGEGGQVFRALTISRSSPEFMVAATDVGGIYRSLDGGAHWRISMAGWDSRGGNALAIDPRNPDRVLGYGGNSMDAGMFNGLYLSVDRAATWKHVLPAPEGNDDREALAFDPSSFDPKLGFCALAYFSTPRDGLWKSLDGGESWKRACPGLPRGIVRVHPTRGFVYLASNEEPGRGFYKSLDGGSTFRRINENFTLGLDVSPASPDSVYVSRWDGVLVSDDAGEAFRNAGGAGLPSNQPIRDLTVSPADPSRMACWHRGEFFRWPRFVTEDGGRTWVESDFGVKPGGNGRIVKNATLPYNVREGLWAWHPASPKVVFANGGDWISRSDDGGRHFRWSNDGENAIMVGGKFTFSTRKPDALLLAFQDYNGAATLDGGKTWTYRDVSGKGWGGYCYGGHTPDGSLMWVGDAEAWGGKRRLRLSKDGGKTWTMPPGPGGKPIEWSGPDVSGSDPVDPAVLFASNWRSADKGKTWAPMAGAEAVYAASPIGPRALYGRNGRDVVKSTDRGATWSVVATAEGGVVDDLAYDHARDALYVASGGRLRLWFAGAWKTLDTPADQYGNRKVEAVAVDPVVPSVVYAGGAANHYATDAAVIRSVDRGESWVKLTAPRPSPGGPVEPTPHEVQAIRVHPTTREAWAAGQCFGVWKIAPPDPAGRAAR